MIVYMKRFAADSQTDSVTAYITEHGWPFAEDRNGKAVVYFDEGLDVDNRQIKAHLESMPGVEYVSLARVELPIASVAM